MYWFCSVRSNWTMLVAGLLFVGATCSSSSETLDVEALQEVLDEAGELSEGMTARSVRTQADRVKDYLRNYVRLLAKHGIRNGQQMRVLVKQYGHLLPAVLRDGRASALNMFNLFDTAGLLNSELQFADRLQARTTTTSTTRAPTRVVLFSAYSRGASSAGGAATTLPLNTDPLTDAELDSLLRELLAAAADRNMITPQVHAGNEHRNDKEIISMVNTDKHTSYIIYPERAGSTTGLRRRNVTAHLRRGDATFQSINANVGQYKWDRPSLVTVQDPGDRWYTSKKPEVTTPQPTKHDLRQVADVTPKRYFFIDDRITSTAKPLRDSESLSANFPTTTLSSTTTSKPLVSEGLFRQEVENRRHRKDPIKIMNRLFENSDDEQSFSIHHEIEVNSQEFAPVEVSLGVQNNVREIVIKEPDMLASRERPAVVNPPVHIETTLTVGGTSDTKKPVAVGNILVQDNPDSYLFDDDIHDEEYSVPDGSESFDADEPSNYFDVDNYPDEEWDESLTDYHGEYNDANGPINPFGELEYDYPESEKLKDLSENDTSVTDEPEISADLQAFLQRFDGEKENVESLEPTSPETSPAPVSTTSVETVQVDVNTERSRLGTNQETPDNFTVKTPKKKYPKDPWELFSALFRKDEVTTTNMPTTSPSPSPGSTPVQREEVIHPPSVPSLADFLIPLLATSHRFQRVGLGEHRPDRRPSRPAAARPEQIPLLVPPPRKPTRNYPVREHHDIHLSQRLGKPQAGSASRIRHPAVETIAISDPNLRLPETLKLPFAEINEFPGYRKPLRRLKPAKAGPMEPKPFDRDEGSRLPHPWPEKILKMPLPYPREPHDGMFPHEFRYSEDHLMPEMDVFPVVSPIADRFPNIISHRIGLSGDPSVTTNVEHKEIERRVNDALFGTDQTNNSFHRFEHQYRPVAIPQDLITELDGDQTDQDAPSPDTSLPFLGNSHSEEDTDHVEQESSRHGPPQSSESLYHTHHPSRHVNVDFMDPVLNTPESGMDRGGSSDNGEHTFPEHQREPFYHGEPSDQLDYYQFQFGEDNAGDSHQPHIFDPSIVNSNERYDRRPTRPDNSKFGQEGEFPDNLYRVAGTIELGEYAGFGHRHEEDERPYMDPNHHIVNENGDTSLRQHHPGYPHPTIDRGGVEFPPERHVPHHFPGPGEEHINGPSLGISVSDRLEPPEFEHTGPSDQTHQVQFHDHFVNDGDPREESLFPPHQDVLQGEHAHFHPDDRMDFSLGQRGRISTTPHPVLRMRLPSPDDPEFDVNRPPNTNDYDDIITAAVPPPSDFHDVRVSNTLSAGDHGLESLGAIVSSVFLTNRGGLVSDQLDDNVLRKRTGKEPTSADIKPPAPPVNATSDVPLDEVSTDGNQAEIELDIIENPTTVADDREYTDQSSKQDPGQPSTIKPSLTLKTKDGIRLYPVVPTPDSSPDDAAAGDKKPSDDANGDASAPQRLAADHIAYILIGTTCGLSLLCLVLVAITMKCRSDCGPYAVLARIFRSDYIQGLGSRMSSARSQQTVDGKIEPGQPTHKLGAWFNGRSETLGSEKFRSTMALPIGFKGTASSAATKKPRPHGYSVRAGSQGSTNELLTTSSSGGSIADTSEFDDTLGTRRDESEAVAGGGASSVGRSTSWLHGSYVFGGSQKRGAVPMPDGPVQGVLYRRSSTELLDRSPRSVRSSATAVGSSRRRRPSGSRSPLRSVASESRGKSASAAAVVEAGDAEPRGARRRSASRGSSVRPAASSDVRQEHRAGSRQRSRSRQRRVSPNVGEPRQLQTDAPPPVPSGSRRRRRGDSRASSPRRERRGSPSGAAQTGGGQRRRHRDSCRTRDTTEHRSSPRHTRAIPPTPPAAGQPPPPSHHTAEDDSNVDWSSNDDRLI